MNIEPFKLVSIRRARFDHSSWYGFIVSESEAMIIVHTVSKRYDLDGYRVCRRCDITKCVESFSRRDLVERALRLKGLRAEAPRVGATDDMRTLMNAVQKEYELVTIHREALYPDECEIGQVHTSSSSTYKLRWLDIDARWSPDDRTFRYRDVTRVDFDGEYERTLLAVAKDREAPG